MTGNEHIILLHGIARTSYHLRKLASYLTRQGYNVLNVDYPSTRYSLEDLKDIIWEKIKTICESEDKVHFVGYSMGGLLIRVLLSEYRPVNLGRVVQLAPPNKGSEVADFLKNNPLYKKFYGPAGQQLLTDQTAIRHLLKPIDYELGVIAGNISLDPLSSLLIKGRSDGKVSIQNTKIEGMKDFIIVPACHTFFPHSHKAQFQTACFLKNGCFDIANHRKN